jgi:DNA-binding transcriptional LysR family regulator
MDLLRSVTIFLRVVESGSFAGAARHLDLSTASVSRQIAFLEQTVGARLINRTTRKLGLTEIGQICFERYSRIVGELDEVQQLAQAGTVSPQGTLRVASVMLFWIWRIAAVLPEFLTRHPNLRVQITLTERVVDLVEDGYDIALQFEAPRGKSLQARRIVPIHRAVYASPAYVRSHPMPRKPADLRGHNCLLYARHTEEIEWEFRRNGETTCVKVDGSLRSNDALSVRQAALQGLGIARGPVFLAHDDLQSGRLVRVLPDYEVSGLELWAVHLGRQRLPAKVRVFIAFLEEKFGSDPALTLPLGTRLVHAPRKKI